MDAKIRRFVRLLGDINNGLSCESKPRVRLDFYRSRDAFLAALQNLLADPFYKEIFEEIQLAHRRLGIPVERIPAELGLIEEYADTEHRLFKKYGIRNPLLRRLSRLYSALRSRKQDDAALDQLFSDPRTFLDKLNSLAEAAFEQIDSRRKRHEKRSLRIEGFDALTQVHFFLIGIIGLCLNLYDEQATARMDKNLLISSISIGRVFVSAGIANS